MTEILRGLEDLKSRGMDDCFKLLHFHLGSQITNIRNIKEALNEAARVYVELAKRGAGLEYLDVGGGLGVDYDGSQTNFESSVNYTLQEYANDVVYHIKASATRPACRTRRSSPRAAGPSSPITACWSSTCWAWPGRARTTCPPQLPDDAEQPLHDLFDTYQERHRPQRAGKLPRRPAGARHGAEPVQPRLPAARAAEPGREPVLGHLPQDPAADRAAGVRARGTAKGSTRCSRTPTSATSRCSSRCPTAGRSSSFSRSCRSTGSNERPTRHAVLGDITCDSDGKIDQFIDRRDVKRTLPLHPFNGEPYYLGAFLLGAYQEILGDLHNLFGDTNAVHVSLDDDGEVVLDTVIKGDTVREVLDYVEFDADEPDAPVPHRRRSWPSAKAASATKRPAGSSSSTKTACKATPTWKSRTSCSRGRPILCPMTDARRFSRVRGVIFDLDGTLVESHLDFNAMRIEMELPEDAPVLETILTLDEARAAQCWQVLERHERRGAERATIIPGVRSFLATLAKRGLPQGIVTRNSRRFAHETLGKLSLRFDPVMTRDDAPIKPRPEAIWEICKKWDCDPAEVIMIGDFRFDLEAGRAAGTRTVLYTRQGALANRAWAAQADFLLHSFEEAAGFWAWLDEPI